MFVSSDDVVDVVVVAIGIMAIARRGSQARRYFDMWEGRNFLGMRQPVLDPRQRLDYERSVRRLFVVGGIISIIVGLRSLFKHHM